MTNVLDSLDTTNEPATPAKDSKSDDLSTLDTLVGEGRKYTDVEALAKSRVEADEFIEQLKAEGAEMREQLGKLEEELKGKAEVEELLKNLTPKQEVADNQTQLTAEDVTKIIQDQQQQTVAEQNKKVVEQKVLDKFNGDTEATKLFLREQLVDAGVSASDFQALAKNSPKAALRLVGIDANITKPTQTPAVSTIPSVNNEQIPEPSVRNDAYYRALRQKMGSKAFYADHNLQKEKFDQLNKLGDEFFKTD